MTEEMKKLLAVFCPVVSVPVISITEIQKKKIKENKINNVVENMAEEKIMTEEKKKKIEEIYNLYSFDFRFLLIKKDEFIKITISLAKVFNKDITEEEAEKIININKVISGSANPIKNNIATFWAIVDYFDKGFDKKQEQKKKEIKEAAKIEKIINSSEEKYKKEFEEINTFHFDIYGEHSCPIARMLFIPMPGLSFFENQFATAESWMEWLIFSIKSNYMAVKNIIDLTVALSEAFNKNMTKEESEKLLFVKSEIPKENIENYSLPPCNYSASTEFRNILHSYHFNGRVYNSIFKLIGWAIADYFDGIENNNNKNNNNNNEEENKNFNKENKINNVVENTAKEKIMIDEQKKKCEEIINSYKTKLGDIDIGLLINPFSSIFQSVHQYAVENITYMTISLAKVFNKDINEKEAEKIVSDLREDLKQNPKDEKYKDFESMSWAIVDKLDDELILNLLILGQTGVGKSSLINALFGEIVAKAGPGKPISTHIKKYETELDGKKVNLYDSMGFEVNNEKCIKDIKNALKERSADKDIKDWFHSVTYCIQAGGLKIQDFDIKMIKQFVDENYNVIIALTKSDQIGKAKREEFIEIIKKEVKEETKKDIMVITVSADPEQLDHMTEKPKPSGLEEYKAAILISWREIFINRIPLNIIEKLKKDIENAKKNAPREGGDLEKLAKEIQEYFINVVKEKVQSHLKDNFEKYYKITEDIFAASKNIDISNLNMYRGIDDNDYIFNVFSFNDTFDTIVSIISMVVLAPLTIISGLIDLIQLIVFNISKSEKTDKFIDELSQKIIDKISEEEFESEIRKIIINALNEIDKKIIKLN